MRTIIATALLLSALGGGASAMSPAPQFAPMADTDMVIRVAGGCGPGLHRGPYGGCLRNFANPGAHACPRGFHIGPGGGCRGNGR
jgi:hypothetical protein